MPVVISCAAKILSIILFFIGAEHFPRNLNFLQQCSAFKLNLTTVFVCSIRTAP